MRFRTMSELGDTIKGAIELSNGTVKVLNPDRVRDQIIGPLVDTAVFHEKADLRGTARWIIKMAAIQMGAYPSSVQELYDAMGQEKCGGFTVPAINIRGLAYDTSRALIRAVRKNGVGAFILEIAKSEMGYTHQSPSEYAAVVLAGAIREGFQGPLFIQGDHFQANSKSFRKDRQKEIEGLRVLIRDAISAGFLNIDIDSSTLVDLDRPNVVEQQRDNFEVAADLTVFIRSLQPTGVTISVGGEIGEVGGKNSTVEEFRVFIDNYNDTLRGGEKSLKGISKISVQTGTSHGGVPLPDGTVAKVNIDFNVLEDISKVARREYGLAGAVQHGASTLPSEVFDRFPKAGTAEIHLATEFQNMIYDMLPTPFKEEIYRYLHQAFGNERKPGETEEQFIYKTRKKALGPFKEKFWGLPTEVREEISRSLEEKFEFLFKKLNVINTRSIVKQYVRPVAVTFKVDDEMVAAGKESTRRGSPEPVDPRAD